MTALDPPVAVSLSRFNNLQIPIATRGATSALETELDRASPSSRNEPAALVSEGTAIRVLKFGGTSLNGAERLQTVAAIIEQRGRGGPCVVVTSALAGVTDALEAALTQATERGETDRSLSDHLITRHLGFMRRLADEEATQPYVAQLSLAIVKLERMLKGVALLGRCPAITRAEILAIGERLSAPLISAALRRRGLQNQIFDGSDLIVLSHGSATDVDFEETRRRARVLNSLSRGEIAVITGFLARDPAGHTAVLGRGASDYSAALLAAALGAAEVEIWTDVDGVMSADPRHVPEAVNVPHLTYDQAAQLANLGAQVLHPKTLEPLRDKSIPVRIRNTLCPDHPGTVIDDTHKAPGRTIAQIPNVVRYELRLRNALGNLDLTTAAGLGEPPLLLSWGASRRSLSLVVSEAEATRIEIAMRPSRSAHEDLQLIRRQDLALVTVLGPSDAFPSLIEVLAEEGITAHEYHSSDGPSGTLSFLLSRRDSRRAVRLLHRAFVGSAPSPSKLRTRKMTSSQDCLRQTP